MFAIIKTGGKQLRVSVNDEIYVEKLDAKPKEKISFDNILMVNDVIGAPYVKDAKVIGVVIKQDKAKKTVVFKYKPKKNYHKKYGHRQPYTKIQISEIILGNKENVVENTTKPATEKVQTK